MTPEMYIHTRTMNGMSWAMSGVREPSRATMRARPVLNTAWNSNTGIARNHDRAGFCPKHSRITSSAAIE